MLNLSSLYNVLSVRNRKLEILCTALKENKIDSLMVNIQRVRKTQTVDG